MVIKGIPFDVCDKTSGARRLSVYLYQLALSDPSNNSRIIIYTIADLIPIITYNTRSGLWWQNRATMHRHSMWKEFFKLNCDDDYDDVEEWKLVNADTVKCELLFETGICLGPGNLYTNNMWFSPENADSV